MVPATIAVTLLAGVAAVAAWSLLGGWWATAGAVLCGVAALAGVIMWRGRWVVIDTPSGPLTWATFGPRSVAEAFCAHAASLAPVAQEEPCPPSS